MKDISKIDPNNYVTIQKDYAVINEGTGYAIINIYTKQIIAQNISSFLDCVKTLEYFCNQQQNNVDSGCNGTQYAQTSSINNLGVKPDVHQVILTYAPTTFRVEKKTNMQGARYKCYDKHNHYLGQVRGKLGNRYWKDKSGNKYY